MYYDAVNVFKQTLYLSIYLANIKTFAQSISTYRILIVCTSKGSGLLHEPRTETALINIIMYKYTNIYLLHLFTVALHASTKTTHLQF